MQKLKVFQSLCGMEQRIPDTLEPSMDGNFSKVAGTGFDGMCMWRKRNDDGATLVFLCELAPRPYAITDGEQRELSDRWQEALQIRR